jgi:hypothetical protein
MAAAPRVVPVPPSFDEELREAAAPLLARLRRSPPPARTLRVLCVMMQRDEARLLDPWIGYHAAMFGIENLLLLDNGSRDPAVLARLDRAEREGAMVLRGLGAAYFFEHKGRVFAALTRMVGRLVPHDFFMPLDCDEFVALQHGDGRVTCTGEEMAAALAAGHRDDRRVLMIHGSYFNIPGQPDRWFFINEPKCFFAGGMVRWLHMGFHRGGTEAGEEGAETAVVHFHLRYRPYEEYVASARHKLAARVGEYTPEEVRRSVSGGSHMAELMFRTREEYEQVLQQRRDRVRNAALRLRLEALGLPVPY